MASSLFKAESSESEMRADLESERIKLLRLIRTRDTSTKEYPSTRMTKMHEEYNEIVNKLQNMDQISSQDPLEALPAEISTQILEVVAYDIDNLFILTMVSQYWRDFIIGTPRLWSRIDIGRIFEGHDGLAKLKTCLHLSGISLLTLYMDIEPNWSYDMISPLIRPHANRIWCVIGVQFGLDFLASLGHLPALRTVYLYTPPFNTELWTLIIANAPRLAFIDAQLAPKSFMLSPNNTKALYSLNVLAGLDDIIPHLEEMPSLKHLWLSDVGSGSPENSNTTIRHTWPARLSLLSLHSLGLPIGSYDSSSLSRFLSMTPTISSLHIGLSFQKMNELIRLLVLLRHLRSLTLTLDFLSGESLYDAAGEWAVMSRQHTHSSLLEPGNFSATKCHQLVCCSVSTLSTLFPQGVKPLFTRFWSHTLPSLFISSLPRLVLLFVQIELNPGEKAGLTIKSSSLTSVSLHVELGEILRLSHDWIQCGRLTDLEIEGNSADNCPYLRPVVPAIDINPTLNTRLHSLSLSRWRLAPEAFDSLRRLELRDTTAIADLCIRLISMPEHLPTLEHLGFLAHPEWDLLFLMLEHRNFLLHSRVSPIKSLQLLSTISLTLLRPITKLLQGHFTNRPSNEELSATTIAETLFDASITGCMWCCWSWQNCVQPVTGQRYSSINISRRTINSRAWNDRYNVMLPFGFERMEERRRFEIDWNRRVDAWNAEWDREAMCRIREMEGHFLITEATLCG